MRNSGENSRYMPDRPLSRVFLAAALPEQRTPASRRSDFDGGLARVAHHAGEAHRDMGAPNMADRLEVADLEGSQDIGHLSMECREFLRAVEARHQLQADPGGL